MRVAIMQPYFFPYLGYFQLITASDQFIFFDDVNFIKKGWIHRNRLCFNGQISWFTVPIQDASQFRTIHETLISETEFHIWKRKLRASLFAFYGKQTYFEDGLDIFDTVLSSFYGSIADLAISSIRCCCAALEIPTPMKNSSSLYHPSQAKKEARLVEICQQSKADIYINAIGGESLYTHEMFSPYGIQLQFLRPYLNLYTVQNRPFIPGLSILDALMCCGRQFVREALLDGYEIVEVA